MIIAAEPAGYSAAALPDHLRGRRPENAVFL
jgi:hypothetical protein